MNSAALVRLSRRLSYILRHDPASVGLTLDPQGWVAVDDLLAALGASASRDDLDAVVAGNDKRRYAIRRRSDGRDEIRANQGHSVPVDLGLDQVSPPPVLYHGTSAAALPSIRARGLERGGRHHVHLSPDVTTAQVVGRRRRGPVAVLAVDAAAMAAAGHAFYRSSNGVWAHRARATGVPTNVAVIASSASAQVGVCSSHRGWLLSDPKR